VKNDHFRKKKLNYLFIFSCKCEQLSAQNQLLKQQLDEANKQNDTLTTDFQKLTLDWEGLRDELVAKEDEWKEEEQVISNHDCWRS
jgi:rootletin